MSSTDPLACPSCERDLSYPGAPGHECYAALIAQVRADERQKVAARLADEGTVEKVAGALLQRAALGIGALDDYSESDREFFRGDARAVLDVIAGLIGDGDR